jgi:myo-inositol 2-dehydrogenase/D-chiro-inositol 1-dehydrogenase
VTACGLATLHPELLLTNDRGNAVGIVEYHNGKIAYFFASRMMAHDQEGTTEFIGTEGKVSANVNLAKDLVTLCHPGGITRQVPEHFWARFEHAFHQDLVEFVDACLLDKPLPLQLATAVKAVEIAVALQESVVTGKSIFFNEGGQRKQHASL